MNLHATSINPISPRERYAQLLAAGQITADSAHNETVGLLQVLYEYLLSQKSQTGWMLPWRRAINPLAKAGIYIWGDVGRGKSMLMDLFFDCLPARLKPQRMHFHRFMMHIHSRLHEMRLLHPEEPDPLALVVQEVRESTDILCLDEFQVHDITDAMILSRLFTLLLDSGLILLTTSNRPPEDLYLHGLQRQSFLPFITLLNERLTIHHLQSATDYRLQKLRGCTVYFSPDDSNAHAAIDTLAKQLSSRIFVLETLMVKGRKLEINAAEGIARSDFDTLCREARGAEDYEELAKTYHTLILEHIPQMTHEDRNEAKRFVTLIDMLYEHKVTLICSAATTPDQLYPSGDGSFEFQRTVSRLIEMQSEAYLGASHIC
jgi:cell division protein ZapE